MIPRLQESLCLVLLTVRKRLFSLTTSPAPKKQYNLFVPLRNAGMPPLWFDTIGLLDHCKDS